MKTKREILNLFAEAEADIKAVLVKHGITIDAEGVGSIYLTHWQTMPDGSESGVSFNLEIN